MIKSAISSRYPRVVSRAYAVMVYIVVVNPIGFREFSQEKVFDSFMDADIYMREFYNCHANECEYRLYSARNEYDAKRRLIKQVL